jgi:monovalent cation/hydrogen antiporter
VVVIALIATRFAWLFPSVWTSRWRRKRVPDAASPRSARETAVTAWAGMRGVVTVATALALPLATDGGDAFPERHLIVFVALVAVLVTLVLQGLTLAPVVRWLHVGGDSRVDTEVRALRRRAMVAALDVIGDDDVETPERVRNAVALQYEGYLAAHDALGTARHGAADNDDDPGDENAVEALLRRAAEAERDVVIRARHVGEVSPEAADEVMSEVEARLVRGTE